VKEDWQKITNLAKRGLLKKGDNGNKKNKGKWEKYFAS